MDEFIGKAALLAEYDKHHVGPPGGARKLIEEAPAVDAVLVVHGRWIWKAGKCFCSICSEEGDPKRCYEDGTADEYDFCPNCGTKMDLKE